MVFSLALEAFELFLHVVEMHLGNVRNGLVLEKITSRMVCVENRLYYGRFHSDVAVVCESYVCFMGVELVGENNNVFLEGLDLGNKATCGVDKLEFLQEHS